MRVRAFEVQARRNLPLPHAQSRLDQPRDPGRRLEVADIGLDRTDDAGALPRASFAKHRTDRARFDRITDRGPGAVRLDIADMARANAGSRAGLPQHSDLRVAAGDRDRAGAAVLVDGSAPDHRVDAVAIAQRSRQELEDHDAGAFAADIAVGARIERLAAAVRRQHGSTAEGDGDVGREHDVHAPDHGGIAFAGQQGRAGRIERHQRRRARGIDREARPPQVEAMRQPVGHDTECAAGGGVNIDLPPAELLDPMVVAVRNADVDTGAAAGQAFRRDPRIFKRTPRDLEQQSLLRIHRRRFARRDSEKPGIERRDVAQQAGAPSDRLARRPGRRIVDRVDVPAIRRHLDDRIASPGEELPQRIRRLDAARKCAADADDGDLVGEFRNAGGVQHANGARHTSDMRGRHAGGAGIGSAQVRTRAQSIAGKATRRCAEIGDPIWGSR